MDFSQEEELSQQILSQHADNQVFNEFYNPSKKNLIALSWYGKKKTIKKDGKKVELEMDIIVTSRKIKNMKASPSTHLFRTHQYEFLMLPNNAFFESNEKRGNFFCEIKLFKEINSESNEFEEYMTDGIPVVESNFVNKYTHFIATVSWPKEVTNVSFGKTKKVVNDARKKTSYRGNFCFEVNVFRKIGKDTYKKLYTRVSSIFKVVSKPGVYLRKEKKNPTKTQTKTSITKQRIPKTKEEEIKEVNEEKEELKTIKKNSSPKLKAKKKIAHSNNEVKEIGKKRKRNENQFMDEEEDNGYYDNLFDQKDFQMSQGFSMGLNQSMSFSQCKKDASTTFFDDAMFEMDEEEFEPPKKKKKEEKIEKQEELFTPNTKYNMSMSIGFSLENITSPVDTNPFHSPFYSQGIDDKASFSQFSKIL